MLKKLRFIGLCTVYVRYKLVETLTGIVEKVVFCRFMYSLCEIQVGRDTDSHC